MHRLRAAPALTVLLLCGCAVGPDFSRPAAPEGAGYAPKPLPEATATAAAYGGEAQRFHAGQDVAFDWWTAFQCPPLNALVTRALDANPTIEAAKAALNQAREQKLAAQGAFFPQVTGDFSASRNKTPTAALSPASASGNPFYNLYTAQAAVSFTPDVFGATRRRVESLEAQRQFQRYELEAAYVTLAANVVGTAIQEVDIREQIKATREIIDIETKGLEILKNQQKYGYAMGIDVAAQEAALAQAQEALPPLEKQLEQTRDMLRALVGNLPNEDVTATFDLAAIHLPQDLPLSLPSKIIEQRPDVRAAEEQMRSANANVGAAIAAMLPQFSLSPVLGAQSNTIGGMFGPGTAYWSLIGSVAQTIFDGGTLLHTRRAADEALVQAAAQYRSAVLTAFQNVADTLHALHADANTMRAAAAAERAAKKTLDLTLKQSQVGYVNYLTLLSAEQAYQTALLTLVQAQGTRFADTAALFQALGGGWWNRKEVAMGDAAKGGAPPPAKGQ
jgi:NodT family efflux transporter outer membrane factor (OMF) lipoprotein